MGLFKSDQGFLGVDFDDKSIKVIELEDIGDRPKLVTYGFLDYELEGRGANNQKVKRIAALIKAVCKKAKTKTKKAVGSLLAFEVFSSIITLPKYSKSALPAAIEAEAKKVIPLPIEEMVLDWHIISDQKNFSSSKVAPAVKEQNFGETATDKRFLKISKEQEESQRILFTAVPKKLVKERQDIFKVAGLDLVSLESDSFALIRSLVGRDKAVTMIVDISSLVTNILVVSRGIPVLVRTMNFGGLTITQALSKNLNISLARAEQFKYDIGVKSTDNSQIPNLIIQLIKPLVEEIKYTLNLYSDKDNKKVEKIILTGGSSLLVNLPQHLAQNLEAKVYLGDPWARVVYPEELKPVLDEIGPRFATTIGLAMGSFRQIGKATVDLKMDYLKIPKKSKEQIN